MPEAPRCPPAVVLDQLSLGLLPDDDLLRVGRHLETCRQCLTYVGESDPSDSVIAAVRRRGQGAVADDPAAARIAAAVLQHTVTYHSHDSENESPPHQPLDDVSRLGPYRLVRLMGAGGMGVVFEAEDTRLARPVALKLLRPDWAGRPEARRRFLDEARALAAVPDPHIVPIYDVGEDGGWLYIAMPLLEGETLQQRLEGDERLPWNEVARIGLQVSEALDTAHQRGFTHRDIKPNNLWIETGTGQVKLLDFGLARAVGEMNDGEAGVIVGTPAYMAPEQARGEPEPRSDLYSLGCVLFRAGTGRLPFDGTDPLGIIVQAATEPVSPVRQIARDCPPDLASLIERLLAKSPDDRPPSAGAVIEAIHGWHRQLVRRRVRRLAAVFVAIALIVAGIGIAAGPAIHRIVTNQGELVIEADDPDVEVAVRKRGGAVVIRDGKAGKKYTLKAGTYELELVGEKPEHTLSANKFTLLRGETSIVTIRYTPWPAGELRVFDGFLGDIHALSLSADGKLALAGAGGPELNGLPSPDVGAGAFLWQPTREGERQQLVGTEKAVRVIALSPDGKSAIAGDRLGGLFLWDIPAAKPGQLLRREGSPATAISWSSKGTHFATAHEDGRVGLWERDGKLVNTFAITPSTAARSLAFLGSSEQVLIGSDDTVIRLVDLKAGKLIREYRGHTDKVTAIAAHPDGKRFLSGGFDGAALLWTTADDKQPLIPTPNWKQMVWSVAFGSEGRLAYFSLGRSVVCWDVLEGREKYRFDGHTGSVRAVCPLPDGRRILSAGWDRTVRLWAIPADKKIATGR